jgi:hypothetical protein
MGFDREVAQNITGALNMPLYPPLNMRLYPPESDCISRIHAQLEQIVKNSILYRKFDLGLTREQLSTLIETAFWASLRSNEGRTTRVRLAVATHDLLPDANVFVSPIPYGDSEIVKLAPAVPLNACLGLATADGNLQIWGVAGRSEPATLAIEITEPGTVRVDVGVFRPYAVLCGRSDVIIGASRNNLAHYLRKLAKALPNDDILEAQAVWQECLALTDLMRMILSDGHGGAVLLVPSETGEWSTSLIPFPFCLKTHDTTVRDAIRKKLNEEHNTGKAQEEFLQLQPDDRLKAAFYRAIDVCSRSSSGGWRDAISAIASFAKVDGAVVMTRDMRLLGFGAKIQFKPDEDVRVCMATLRDQKGVYSSLENLGGMRHQSAARFINQNKDAIAIVVSQDRHVSVMNWEHELKSVFVFRNAEWWV